MRDRRPRISQTLNPGFCNGPPPHSALAPDDLTTLLHLSVSAAMKAPNSAGA